MTEQEKAGIQAGYDRVADEYVRRIYNELRDKPLDRHLLDRFGARVRSLGPACDIGCGPGHVARYLHDRGLKVCGIDLSIAMVERARRLNPGIEFKQGDMFALDVADGVFAGIAAFYAIVNLPRQDVPQALNEMRRALMPGGWLLLAFHIGDKSVHLDEWWDHKVNVDFHFHRPEEIAGHLKSAGLEIEEIIEREPYPEVEHQSRRAYIFARVLPHS